MLDLRLGNNLCLKFRCRIGNIVEAFSVYDDPGLRNPLYRKLFIFSVMVP